MTAIRLTLSTAKTFSTTTEIFLQPNTINLMMVIIQKVDVIRIIDWNHDPTKFRGAKITEMLLEDRIKHTDSNTVRKVQYVRISSI